MPAGRGGRRYLPYAFTEHGAIQAANVLNSPRAIQMGIYVVRAFVQLRELLWSAPPWHAIRLCSRRRICLQHRRVIYQIDDFKKQVTAYRIVNRGRQNSAR